MITPDIRKIVAQSQNETMRIVIYFEIEKFDIFIRLIQPPSDRFEPVYLAKSYRYGNSVELLEQYALAICLELYTVSDAVKFYKEFYRKYLKPIAQPNRDVPNVSKTVFHRELFVPIKPVVV
jgi:hypothetical protein